MENVGQTCIHVLKFWRKHSPKSGSGLLRIYSMQCLTENNLKRRVGQLFFTSTISEKWTNEKAKPGRSSGFRTKTFGQFTRCHGSTSYPHSLTKLKIVFHVHHPGKNPKLRRLRSDKLSNTLSWIRSINSSAKICSSSFQITIEGLTHLSPVITSLADQLESSLTRLSSWHYSQTTMTNGLEIGWQTLLILILFTQQANLIWDFFDNTGLNPASFVKTFQ